MADRIVPNLTGANLDLRLRDMGDGSYALVTAPGGAAPLGTYIGKAGAFGAKPVASFTRPANTTPYNAGDVAGTDPATILEFTGAALNPAGTGMVYGALLIDKANQATKLAAPELWLFTMPPAGVADNAAFAPSDAELMNLVGVLPFETAYVGNAGAGDNGNVAFLCKDRIFAYQCAPGRTSLYGVLVVRNAYTPISAEQFSLRIDLLLD